MIKIIDYKENPITHIGKCVGLCYGSDTTDDAKNLKRGLNCIESNHGRTMEYPDITIEISGYSMRVIRELYTHIEGVTRTQESTRYVKMDDFDFYIPPKIKSDFHALQVYKNTINEIKKGYNKLMELGMTKEDSANILPLCSNTKVCLKINLRALIHLFEVRECTRAYIEFRELMKELKHELSMLSDEWKWICDNLLRVSCLKRGYCLEEFCCGLRPRFKDIEIVMKDK